MNARLYAPLLAVFIVLVLTGAGCGADKNVVTSPPALTASPTAVPTASPADRASTAEARYLVKMSPELAETIRAQPWYPAMEPEHLSLIGVILETERAANERGERGSVASAFAYAAEQGWYEDGFDVGEAIGLRAVFQTYTVSLTDRHAPKIGPVLASTIAHQLTVTLDLPESGQVVVLVSADDPELGRRALDMAAYWLPQVEEITGEFPYSFLHLTVTDLPEMLGGLSYDEFIALSTEHVDDETIVHELTHSTLYGIFPTWFEEGFAYYMQHYLTGTLEEGTSRFLEDLALLDAGRKLEVSPRANDEYQYFIDQARGYLFIKGLVELSGWEAVIETIKTLRTRTITDQQLLKQLIETDNPEHRAALEQYLCENVSGTTREYCN